MGTTSKLTNQKCQNYLLKTGFALLNKEFNEKKISLKHSQNIMLISNLPVALSFFIYLYSLIIIPLNCIKVYLRYLELELAVWVLCRQAEPILRPETFQISETGSDTGTYVLLLLLCWPSWLAIRIRASSDTGMLCCCVDHHGWRSGLGLHQIQVVCCCCCVDHHGWRSGLGLPQIQVCCVVVGCRHFYNWQI